MSTSWMIYGANGYTGELIAREAARRGLRPILAGRRADQVEALASELGLESRVFALDSPQLRDVSAVLHCAGPFSKTSEPMVRACLEAGAHYLDITGEISVFEMVLSMDDEAKRRGVALLPGVGFDVVPSDSLAAMLAQRLQDAVDLALAFYTKGGEVSRGTMKTMIEGIGEQGAIRRDGKIVRVSLAYDVREIPFSIAPRLAMTIPWGDVSTAFHSTGIPNIRVYYASSPRAISRARMMGRLRHLLGFAPVKRLLLKFADRRTGPDAQKRESARTYLWGRATNAAGQSVEMTMTTPEGYAFTALSAVSAVERLLSEPVRAGAYTPSKYFGVEFVRGMSGVVID